MLDSENLLGLIFSPVHGHGLKEPSKQPNTGESQHQLMIYWISGFCYGLHAANLMFDNCWARSKEHCDITHRLRSLPHQCKNVNEVSVKKVELEVGSASSCLGLKDEMVCYNLMSSLLRCEPKPGWRHEEEIPLTNNSLPDTPTNRNLHFD